MSAGVTSSGLSLRRTVPAGSYANRNLCAQSVREVGTVDRLYLDIIADAQTLGGLLLAVPAAEAQDAVCGPQGCRTRRSLARSTRRARM
jgi:hypothetical protein